MTNAIAIARTALQAVLKVGRGTSGRLILEVRDEQALRNALESMQAAEMSDTRVPYAWEVTQGRRTFFVPAAEFTKSSYDTGTFKPLFE